MVIVVAKIAAELRAMRVYGAGQSARRAELRRAVMAADPQIRNARNRENIKLAGLRARLRHLDTRQDPRPLQAEAEASERRLEDLEHRLASAIARRMGG